MRIWRLSFVLVVDDRRDGVVVVMDRSSFLVRASLWEVVDRLMQFEWVGL